MAAQVNQNYPTPQGTIPAHSPNHNRFNQQSQAPHQQADSPLLQDTSEAMPHH